MLGFVLNKIHKFDKIITEYDKYPFCGELFAKIRILSYRKNLKGISIGRSICNVRTVFIKLCMVSSKNTKMYFKKCRIIIQEKRMIFTFRNANIFTEMKKGTVNKLKRPKNA